MLDIQNISKTFEKGTVNEHVAINNLSLKLEDGEFVTVVGSNGAGKSTLFNAICGSFMVDEGHIFLDDMDITYKSEHSRAKMIGRVFQDPMKGTAPNMTIEENLALAYTRASKQSPFSRAITKKKIQFFRENLARYNMGIEDRMKTKIGLLSGGQRQRVAFARALAPNPQLLLLDEPFAAIDAKVRQELRSWLKEMIEKLGVTSIFVTHDQDEAIEVADEIIITNKGRVEQKGSPVEIYQNPQTAFAASFFGQTSLIENYTSFSTFDEIEKADSAILRPEFVKITKKNEVQKYKTSAAEGVVERVSFRGNNIELTVRCKDNVFTARRGLDENPIEAGEKVDVFIYRMFVTAGDKAYLIENKALNENSMII